MSEIVIATGLALATVGAFMLFGPYALIAAGVILAVAGVFHDFEGGN